MRPGRASWRCSPGVGCGWSTGLIFSPLALGPDDVEALRVDFPMVLLGERIFDGAVDHVTMANTDGGELATRHLLDLGRRRIAVLGVPAGEAMGSEPLRLRGYTSALAGAGLASDPDLRVEAGQQRSIPDHRRAGPRRWPTPRRLSQRRR